MGTLTLKRYIYYKNPAWIDSLGDANAVPEMLGTDVEEFDIETTPSSLSKGAFQEHVVKYLGKDDEVAGMKRFMQIIDNMANHEKDEIRYIYKERYFIANKFDKPEVEKLTEILAAVGIVSADERKLILSNWPEQPV